MSYRDDLEAMQSQVQQMEGELEHLRRERARLEQVVRDEPRLVTALDRLRRTLHARAPRHLPLLDDIRVASPCHARWDDMTGDAQARHCARCDKNVYNLSAMTREAAEALLREKEGALCVRYFRRVDGTILTADCPVGVRRRRVQRVAAAGVKLMYSPQGTSLTSAYLIPLVADGFMIPPNATDYTYSETFPNPTRALSIKVYGLMPHMHTLGKRITIKGPSDACLVDIPKWDFHWQSQYFRPQPFTVPANGSVTMTCTWDNPTTRTVTWGEGTSDEMCFAFVYATP